MLLSVHRFFFFYKQEIACHSLLLHYKGEGFTCDLSAREPLVHSGLENPGWSSALHPGFTHTALRFSVSHSAALRPILQLNKIGYVPFEPKAPFRDEG